MSIILNRISYLLLLTILLPIISSAQLINPVEQRKVKQLNASDNTPNFFNKNQPSSDLSSLSTTDFDFPVDECFTYTYKVQLGNPSTKLLIKDIFTAINGYTYTVGQIESSDGLKNAFIQRINYKGDVDFTTKIALSSQNSNNDVEDVINSIKELPNGKLVFIGTSKSTSTNAQHLFFGQIDSTGLIDWLKQQNSIEEFEGVSISPTPTAGIGFVGQNSTKILYGKIDYNGDVQWVNTLPLLNAGRVIGMINDASVEWYIGYTGIDSSKRVGALVQIHPSTGQVGWVSRFGGLSQNSDFIFHNLELVNLRPRISGIYATGGSFQFFKLTVNIAGQAEQLQTFRTNGINIDTSARSSLNASAEVFTIQANASDSSLYLFKAITEAYPDTLFAWAKKFSVPAGHQMVTVERAFDGGFMAVTNLKSGEGAVLLKTDSIGMIKNCEGAPFAITSSMKFWPDYAKTTTPISKFVNDFIQPAFFTTNNDIPIIVSCKERSCPPVSQPDTCLQSFIRRYRGVSICDSGSDFFLSTNDEVYMAGTMRDDPFLSETTWSTLVRLKANGQVITRKKLRFGNTSGFRRILPLQDGNVLLLGYSSFKPSPTEIYDTSYTTITKFTKDFQLLWNKSLPVYGPFSGFYGIVEGGDGSLFLHYIEGKNMCENIRILKLDAQGNVLWVKNYKTVNTCAFGYQGSLTQDEDYLYAASYANGTAGALIMKIKKTTGEIVWTKGYTITGANESLLCNDITLIGNKLALVGKLRNDSGGNWSKGVLLLIDKNGTTQKAKAFYNGTSGFELSLIATRNHELVLISPSHIQETFIRMDSSLNLLYAKKTQSKGVGSAKIREASDGSIYGLGQFYNLNVYYAEVALKKFTYDGLLGSCATDTFQYSIVDQSIIESNLSTAVSNHNISVITLPYQERPYSLQQNDLLCASISNCNMLKLNGDLKICDTLDHTFTVTKNSGCTAPVFFSYTDPSIRVKSKTDSSITLQFMTFGNKKLKAKIFTGCRWLEDSVLIQTTIGLKNLNLDPDRSICTGNTILLNAHSGFVSYQWQDGSTDSTFVVTQPGTYHLTATDACGSVFRDSVQVNAAAPISFSIGPDRIKCNSDTLMLSAPGGFLNYSWSNNYQINSLAAQNVVINPLVDTAYYIKAEKTPGCFAYDTVHIKVYRSTLIDLGVDQKFCKGDSVILSAASGFTNYLWSNGIQGSSISVKAVGTYSVMATTSQGCKSYDTMKVVEVYPLPVVSLDQNEGLCKGESRALDAGNFVSYQWQDGSSGRNFIVRDTGLYFVKVTDINGCRGIGVTKVSIIYPVPQRFLPKDTTICSYGKLELKAALNYKSYLWSNGASAATISITQSGIYWLQVKDINNCVGKDTINIGQKQCLNGFYVPTAFTPNRDGKNDVFRPLLFGDVQQYQFSVYNRWGQVVFQTTDLQKGWDGKLRGLAQDGNVFVWTCTYQFQDEPIRYEKGTVTLVR